MAAGVRIQHPTERSCTFTLASDRPLRGVQDACPVCHLTHTQKTYHLVLDAAGATIVSQEIVERLKQIPGQPFAFVDEVREPPKQLIVIGAPPRVPGVVAHQRA